VYFTRIGATCLSEKPEQLARRAIASVLAERRAEDGITYLIAARANGIVTPKSEAYEQAVLKEAQATTLVDALANIRKGAAGPSDGETKR
jgi:hypothetical protein